MILRSLGVASVAVWLWWGAAPATAQRRGPEPAARRPVRGTRGAVAAGTEFATEAGMRLFHQGGNAVDAGVAATLAAAVAEYSHFGFGGEAPILIRTRECKVVSLAGVGPMPRLATAELFRKRRLEPGEFYGGRAERQGLAGVIPVTGLMPALVPGMVDAVLVGLKLYGTKSFADVAQPAAELADGMPLDETRAGSIAGAQRFFSLWPASRAVFLPEGRVGRAGEIFRQPDLARTIRKMAEAERRAREGGKSRGDAIDAVRDYFYRGEVARKIDAFVAAHGGLLRYDDMAGFRVEPEAAVTGRFRDVEVHKPGFWSQGPVLIQALNLIEGTGLRAMKLNTADYLHTLVEALKLAYADRDTYYGDPRFSAVPAQRLLSREYAAERRALIGEQASLEFRPGQAGTSEPRHPSQEPGMRLPLDDQLAARDTTCVAAADRDGVVFAATPSGAWLPSVIAGDTGIPLTQRAQSFLLMAGHPNELAGGKRPRITLSPTLVTRGGQAYLALATPGGDNQDQALLQLLVNVVEFGMNAQQAVEAPRFQTRHLVSSFDDHAMGPGELLLDDRIGQAVTEELRGRGHRISTRSRWSSGAAPVMIRVTGNGVIEAGADPFGYRAAAAW